MNNSNAMHAARQTFIQIESSEKVKHTLTHQIRTSGDYAYTAGDLVLYKAEVVNIGMVQEQLQVKMENKFWLNMVPTT